MFNKYSSKIVSAILMAAIFFLCSSPAFAASDPVTGEINVRGNVMINGQAVISSTTIVSGNVIETGPDSTATVSFGNAGKVELIGSSKLTLNFTENSMGGFLSHGEAKVYGPAGITAEFTTKDVTVSADISQENSFRLLVECAHTHVENFAGSITMKRDKSDLVVRPGEEKIAGDISKANCPVCTASYKKKNGFLVPGLGGGLAGIIAAIIGIGGGGNDVEGPGVNVSPIKAS